MAFEQILGNKVVIKLLRQVIVQGRISHSYLFWGKEGIGKKTLAGEFAKAIQCRYQGAEPECSCLSCKTFDSGNHPDILIIQPEKNKTSIGVTEIRDKLIAGVGVRPFQYRRKIYIIEQAHLLTAQAQNALLKTIEEPPEYAVFLFLAQDTGRLLPTFLSRMMAYQMEGLADSVIVAALHEDKAENGSLAKTAASMAFGSIGQAKALYDSQEFWQRRREVIQVINQIKPQGYLFAFDGYNWIEAHKEDMDDIILIGLLWLRDLLVYKSTNQDNAILAEDLMELVKQESKNCTYQELYGKIDALLNLQAQLGRNVSFPLALDGALLKMMV